ncbi:hypothetical protein CYMTET_9940 [Cymbomonas tetramitiformis]|uniref:Uncharacterized protein n=1 Tax=Cymbomonas tetramitiformis TaxID=36881 RepID=A0AAE0GQI4_9CHLO|nr:hypothetical protein CYMTET_9940 [Cymbomonas tetramitiformis]
MAGCWKMWYPQAPGNGADNGRMLGDVVPTVNRFASEISAQLRRHYAGWKDSCCEEVDSLVYNSRREIN